LNLLLLRLGQQQQTLCLTLLWMCQVLLRLRQTPLHLRQAMLQMPKMLTNLALLPLYY
jgi:hypothetical protein